MMEQIEGEITQITYDVELQVFGQINVPDIEKEYICEETINAGQVVTFGGNGIKVAKANDNNLTSVLGVAITSGQQGEKVSVKIQGVITSFDKPKGLLFCNNDGWLSNTRGNNIVVVGYQFDDSLALVFPQKEIIFVE